VNFLTKRSISRENRRQFLTIGHFRPFLCKEVDIICLRIRQGSICIIECLAESRILGVIRKIFEKFSQIDLKGSTDPSLEVKTECNLLLLKFGIRKIAQ